LILSKDTEAFILPFKITTETAFSENVISLNILNRTYRRTEEKIITEDLCESSTKDTFSVRCYSLFKPIL